MEVPHRNDDPRLYLAEMMEVAWKSREDIIRTRIINLERTNFMQVPSAYKNMAIISRLTRSTKRKPITNKQRGIFIAYIKEILTSFNY